MRGIVLCTVILLLNYLAAEPNEPEVKPEVKWDGECPMSCSCSLGDLRDLPIQRWFLEYSASNNATPANNNEAINEDDVANPEQEDKEQNLLRTAICVFQRGIDPEEWIGSLPSDVQVLTLLQAMDSDQLTLRAEHFANFKHLIALDIQGFHDEKNHPSNENIGNVIEHPLEHKLGDVVIMSDTLRSMNTLQYLHLQNVRLLGQPEVAPKPINMDNLKYLQMNDTPKEKDWKHKHSKMLHELVFLSPSDPLPYNEYKQAQEVAGLSLFRNLSNLKFLRVYQCGLKEIRWEMFDGLTKLMYLSLENNDLHFIPDFAFYGAPHLKSLVLSRNKILSLQFTGFAGLLELEKLDLSYNNISHLSELSLPPLPKLKFADFRHNPIERIFSSTFEIMNKTETIYLGSDETKLDLNHNTWQGLSNLKHLFLFNTKVTELENEVLAGMPKLKELQIQGTIESLSFDAFAAMPKLEELILKNCGIKRVSMDTFYGLHGLLTLDLSYNELTTLPPSVFDHLISLKELYLQHNKLVELPENIFLTLHAKLIRLDFNPWHCSCAMREWRPMQINKIKVSRSSLQSVHQYSKSLMRVRDTQYVFEKRVAPKCKTPDKYHNWNVFHVLRKELRCGKPNGLQTILPRKLYKKGNYVPVQKNNDAEIPALGINNNTVAELNNATVASKIQITTSSESLSENLTTSADTSGTPPTTHLEISTPKPTEYAGENSIMLLEEVVKTEETEPDNFNIISHIAHRQPVKTNPKPQLNGLENQGAVRESPNVNNTYIIQHEGQQLKISKKAYKLELERIRNEKLRKARQ